MKREFGVDCDLVPSGGGVFEIDVDGRTIFSKKRSGRFPEDGEVAKLLRSATG